MKKRALLVAAALTILAAAAWVALRPRAAHDARLAGIWQDERIERARQAAHDRGAVRGQGSWLVLDRNGQGRQIDYNAVTQQSETTFRWRTLQADDRIYFLRSYEAVGEQPGETGRSGEIRYEVQLSRDGERLTLKGQFGTAAEYSRTARLPESVARATGP